MGFVGGNINSCLYIKKSAKGIVYIALYIDDNLLVVDIKAIDDAIIAFKNNGLVLKVVERLQDYLPCEIQFSTEKKGAWLGQSHLIKNIEKKLVFRVTKLQVPLSWKVRRSLHKVCGNIGQV